MRSLGRLFIIFALLSFSYSLFAQDEEDEAAVTPAIEERDIEALRDWVNTKRMVTVKERGGNLSISGEVRTEFQVNNEKRRGIKQRGSRGEFSEKPIRGYDVEVTLLFDYRTERTWATAKIEFDNDAGTISGSFDHLSLERAFFGVRLINEDTYTVDTEFGRRNLGYTFDSRIQFVSFMDGILLKYDHALDWLGDAYFHGGPFVIDERNDQYGYVFEIGILNMFNSGLYAKYSFIDWNTKHFGTTIDNPNDPGDIAKRDKNIIKDRFFRYMNSQVILGYKFAPKRFKKMITLYLAGLLNHAAHSLAITNNTKANWAWYGGFSIGELRKKGDWSFDANYQMVSAQAIPEFDQGGVGRGNAAGAGFYSTKSKGRGDIVTFKRDAIGKGNFKGVAIQFLYLLTNNLTLFQSWNQSVRLDHSIGPTFRYKSYEVELIYAF